MNNNNSPQQPNENNPIDAHTQNELLRIADRYLLQDIIGEGSYSIVFRGYDTQKHRKVAIKELKSKGLTREEADEAQQLFFNEINILKSLEHPGIPKVYDFFIFEGRHYMVMQWVKGESLLSVLERGETLSQGEAVHYMKQISDALVYLQKEERQVIYKDLKPSNILVNENGNAWIIDFGTARFYSPEKKKDTHVLGTPGYAPPEAYTGTQTDFSADIYSLGATFYHLTTGEEPFQFKFKIPPAGKFKPELTEEFSSLLADCLKPRDKRIKNAGDLKREIDRIGFDEDSKEQGESIYQKYSFLIQVGFLIFFAFTIYNSFEFSWHKNPLPVFTLVFMFIFPFYLYILINRTEYRTFLSFLIFITVYFSVSLWICTIFQVVWLKESSIFSLFTYILFMSAIYMFIKFAFSAFNITLDKPMLISFTIMIYSITQVFFFDSWAESSNPFEYKTRIFLIKFVIPPYFISLFLDYAIRLKKLELSKITIYAFSILIYILFLHYVKLLSYSTPFPR